LFHRARERRGKVFGPGDVAAGEDGGATFVGHQADSLLPRILIDIRNDGLSSSLDERED
jgi:hypothetical protein